MSAPASTPQLRPLRIGEILDVGIKIYTRNWLTLWKIVVFVVFPAQILVNAIEVSAAPKGTSFSGGSLNFTPGPQQRVSGHDLAVFAVGVGVALIVGVVSGHLAQAGCFRAVADSYLGEQATWRSSLRYALRRLPAVVALSFIVGLLTFLGVLLCIAPGVYLWGAYYVAIPVLLVEGSGPIKSLGRSRRLVKGRWWTTFGVAVIGYLLVAIVSAALTALVVGVAFASPARDSVTGFVLNTLAATVGSMLTTPAAAAFAIVLYIDLRVRKEGFDLFLLAQRLGLDPPSGAAPATASFMPVQLAPSAAQPPYWPPPPGWTPTPPAQPSPTEPGPPAAPAEEEKPPYWSPPPGWKPGDR